MTTGSVGIWFINGTDSRVLPDEVRNDINTRDNGLTTTLTITARTHYNNTIVQCEAVEFQGYGRERSDNTTLKIQGNVLVYMQNTIIIITSMYVELLASYVVCKYNIITVLM